MKNPNDPKDKTYQKPDWEKQQLFERFTMACALKACVDTSSASMIKT
jgi:hypothetical protein